MNGNGNEQSVDEIVAPNGIAVHESTNDVAVGGDRSLFRSLSLVELCRSSWYPGTESTSAQTYLRGCKWSPDGTCCLSVVNNDGLHLIELPKDLYSGNVNAARSVDVLDSIIHIKESGLIYDFCWYPGMHSTIPETCCWITTKQHNPIQMWDAFDGSLRCSYRGYNVVDEVEPAIAVCFSNDGRLIHAGYKKALKTFVTDRPGRDYVHQPISGTAASMAVSPVDSTIAVGSWKTEISLYDMQDGNAKSIGKMRGHTGGVTHLKFTPDGRYIISGARKDDQLIVWDTRLNRKPFKTLYRKVQTNQRIYFDISTCGSYLVSGNTDGTIKVWNLSEVLKNEKTEPETIYPLHKDCCNGVSIHPHRPLIATSSGQHHVDNSEYENCSDELEYNSDVENKNGISVNENFNTENSLFLKNDNKIITKKEKYIENSLEFWWAGSIE